MEKNKKQEYGRLNLTLKHGDTVVFGDSLITVTQIKNKAIRLQFNAPKNVSIKRTKYIDTGKD